MLLKTVSKHTVPQCFNSHYYHHLMLNQQHLIRENSLHIRTRGFILKKNNVINNGVCLFHISLMAPEKKTGNGKEDERETMEISFVKNQCYNYFASFNFNYSKI